MEMPSSNAKKSTSDGSSNKIRITLGLALFGGIGGRNRDVDLGPGIGVSLIAAGKSCKGGFPLSEQEWPMELGGLSPVFKHGIHYDQRTALYLVSSL
jgi:hypothetical protein